MTISRRSHSAVLAGALLAVLAAGCVDGTVDALGGHPTELGEVPDRPGDAGADAPVWCWTCEAAWNEVYRDPDATVDEQYAADAAHEACISTCELPQQDGDCLLACDAEVTACYDAADAAYGAPAVCGLGTAQDDVACEAWNQAIHACVEASDGCRPACPIVGDP